MTHLSPSPTAPIALTRASPDKAITLQFDDNKLLPLLLGDHDRHLVRIEQQLGVRLSCRGNRVAIAGEAGRVDMAQAALTGLYRRLERGQGVSGSDVDAAVRLNAPEADPRLPLSDLPAIHTRRGAVSPCRKVERVAGAFSRTCSTRNQSNFILFPPKQP